ATTLTRIRDHARAGGQNMWQAARAMATDGLSARAAKAVTAFVELIDGLAQETQELALHEAADRVIQTTQLKAHHGRDKTEKSQGKVENLDELVSAMRGYTPDEDDEDMTPMTQFLAYASLE